MPANGPVNLIDKQSIASFQ